MRTGRHNRGRQWPKRTMNLKRQRSWLKSRQRDEEREEKVEHRAREVGCKTTFPIFFIGSTRRAQGAGDCVESKLPELQKGRHEGGLATDTRARGLKVRPVVTPPITAALMLAEGDAGTRSPIVFVDDHSGGRRIGVALMHVPTNVTVAHDRRRGSYYRRRQNGCARGCTKKDFHHRCHTKLHVRKCQTNDTA